MRLAFGDHLLDVDRRELSIDGEQVEMQRQVFDVLSLLVANRDRVVTKNELLDEVWGNRFVSESAITTRIKEVRRAVGDTGAAQSVIKTVHGVGYRFVADAVDVGGPDAGPASTADAPHGQPSGGGRIKVPRTRYADRSGASLAYQTFGNGPDLLLINGFATNVDLVWEHPDIAAFLGELAAMARVTLFDKRGVGCSERHPLDDAPSLEVRSDDLLAIMDEAGIERATIFGTSEGGSLAVVFTATHPDRVDRLILHGAWAGQAGAVAEHMTVVEDNWGNGAIYGALSPTIASTQDGRRFLARYERQSATPRIAVSLLELLSGLDVRDVLPSIHVPTLILHSDADAWVPFEQAEMFHAGLAGSHLVSLRREDHYLFSGDQSELLAAVRDFLDDQTLGGTSEPERQLASILSVEAADGESWAEADGRFERSARSVIGTGRGELIDMTERGLVAIFDGPGRAIRTATALGRAVAQLGLPVSAGVHCAEIERRGGEVAGVGVETAGRIAELAGPFEVWVSRTITDLVAGNDLSFEPRGEFALDGIERSWELYAVLA